jgi:hypothetical protein
MNKWVSQTMSHVAAGNLINRNTTGLPGCKIACGGDATADCAVKRYRSLA